MFNLHFNPIEIKSDAHLRYRIAIEKVFGKDFLENRTNSCSYHFDKNVLTHNVCIKKEDIEIYMNCVTGDDYHTTKEQYKSLISRQVKRDKKPLISTLNIWDKFLGNLNTDGLHHISQTFMLFQMQAKQK